MDDGDRTDNDDSDRQHRRSRSDVSFRVAVAKLPEETPGRNVN